MTVESHFKDLYKDCVKVSFSAKPLGQQVGTIAKVTFNDGRIVSYFVKAHQNLTIAADSLGHITSDRSKHLDFRELFVYKALELMGVGPKVTFVVNEAMAQASIQEIGLLIASQDVGFTRDSTKTKAFTTYGALGMRVKSDLRKSGLYGDELPEKVLWNELTDRLDPQSLKLIDLLTRVFVLSDVMVNDGNFGCVERAKEGVMFPAKYKIIDFTIACEGMFSDPAKYMQAKIADDFRAVNGRLRYDENVPVRNCLLQGNDISKVFDVVESGRVGANRQKMGLAAALKSAMDEVLGLMVRCGLLLRMKEGLFASKTRDLEVYAEAILANFHAAKVE